MPLSSSDIAALSRLLDEALDLNASQREAWLNNMPAAGRHLVPKLREMLAERNSTGASGFLAALPALDDGGTADEATAREGEAVGPYRLLREIGRGGMGTVWLAERADGAFKRQVALKLPRLTWGAGLAKRMARERDIGAMLEHPNIARLYDAGVDERGRPFIALEHIDGIAIDAWCRQNKLSVRDKLQLIVQVAKAVAYAHGRLVVHRDLKPSNVMVSADGQVHLLDFGIARLLDDAQPQEHAATQEQARVLTPHYASPEQLKGEALTVQSDVYSLGVLAYELLTGQLPHDAKRNTPAAIEEAILQGEVIVPSQRVEDRALSRQLKGDIDAIVGKAMKVEQGLRYVTADALAADIERYLTGETVGARPDSRGYRLRKMLKRHWIGVSASTAVLVSVLGGAGVAVVQAQRAAKAVEKERAVKEFVADVFRINVQRTVVSEEITSSPAQTFLERSANLVQQRFAEQPAMQAELYAVVSKVSEDMGAFKLAAEQSKRRLEAMVQAGGSDVDRAAVLLNLARVQLRGDRLAEAERSARQATELAKGDESTALAAKAVAAEAAYMQGQLDHAARLLDELESRFSALGVEHGVVVAYVKNIRGRWLQRMNRYPEAAAAFNQAIAEATIIEGRDSDTVIAARLDAASHYLRTLDTKTAEGHLAAAVDSARKRGDAGQIKAALATARFAHTRALMVADLSQTATDEIFTRARSDIASVGLAIPQEIAAELDSMQGNTMIFWGKVQAGTLLLDRSVPMLFKSVESPHGRLALASAYGFALMFSGQHEAADAWLRNRLRARVEAGAGSHPFAAYDQYLIAENLMMWGRLDAAEAVLHDVPTYPPLTLDDGSHPNAHNLDRQHLAAEIALLRGDAALARSLVPTELLDPPGRAAPTLEDKRVRSTLGRTLCRTGSQEREGLRYLDEVLLRDERNNYEHAPRMAYHRAEAGMCALKARDLERARALARQAAHSFAMQPGVSDFYKAPLRELEAKLARR